MMSQKTPPSHVIAEGKASSEKSHLVSEALHDRIMNNKDQTQSSKTDFESHSLMSQKTLSSHVKAEGKASSENSCLVSKPLHLRNSNFETFDFNSKIRITSNSRDMSDLSQPRIPSNFFDSKTRNSSKESLTRNSNTRKLNANNSYASNSSCTSVPSKFSCQNSIDDNQNTLVKLSKSKEYQDKFLILCWNCHKLGHTYRKCADSRQKRFCYRCGKPDTDVKQCLACSHRKTRLTRKNFYSKPLHIFKCDSEETLGNILENSNPFVPNAAALTQLVSLLALSKQPVWVVLPGEKTISYRRLK